MTFIEFYEKIPQLTRGKIILIRYFKYIIGDYIDVVCEIKNVNLDKDAIKVINPKIINIHGEGDVTEKLPLYNEIFGIYSFNYEHIILIDINYIRNQKIKKIKNIISITKTK